mmetsp:Transcript_47144/g.142742  ORF Transcript_47144/g.142742 Transcript_47144/m.142742 type:complete len:284 (-) Transcript_47144:217-1068(-)
MSRAQSEIKRVPLHRRARIRRRRLDSRPLIVLLPSKNRVLAHLLLLAVLLLFDRLLAYGRGRSPRRGRVGQFRYGGRGPRGAGGELGRNYPRRAGRTRSASSMTPPGPLAVHLPRIDDALPGRIPQAILRVSPVPVHPTAQHRRRHERHPRRLVLPLLGLRRFARRQSPADEYIPLADYGMNDLRLPGRRGRAIIVILGDVIVEGMRDLRGCHRARNHRRRSVDEGVGLVGRAQYHAVDRIFLSRIVCVVDGLVLDSHALARMLFPSLIARRALIRQRASLSS